MRALLRCILVMCCRSFVSNMVRAVQRGVEDSCYGMLWLFTYAFLLRMPSEVRAFLPLQVAVTVSIVARLYPLANAHQTRRWQLVSRPSSGEKGAPYAYGCSAGKIASMAAAF